MVVEPNERVDEVERVNREPARKCAVNELVMLEFESGMNELLDAEREESEERKMMERYVQDEGAKMRSRYEIVTSPAIVISEVS